MFIFSLKPNTDISKIVDALISMKDYVYFEIANDEILQTYFQTKKELQFYKTQEQLALIEKEIIELENSINRDHKFRI